MFPSLVVISFVLVPYVLTSIVVRTAPAEIHHTLKSKQEYASGTPYRRLVYTLCYSLVAYPGTKSLSQHAETYQNNRILFLRQTFRYTVHGTRRTIDDDDEPRLTDE